MNPRIQVYALASDKLMITTGQDCMTASPEEARQILEALREYFQLEES